MLTKDELLKISKMNALALCATMQEVAGVQLNANQLKAIQGFLYLDLIREGAIDINAKLFDDYIKSAR